MWIHALGASMRQRPARRISPWFPQRSTPGGARQLPWQSTPSVAAELGAGGGARGGTAGRRLSAVHRARTTTMPDLDLFTGSQNQGQRLLRRDLFLYVFLAAHQINCFD
jgi:hypothetical protein